MKKPLRNLHLEDDPDYSDLVRSLLEGEGIPVQLTLVSTRADFEAALALPAGKDGRTRDAARAKLAELSSAASAPRR